MPEDSLGCDGPKSAGSCSDGAACEPALTERKKDVPLRLSSRDRPLLGPNRRTGQPAAPMACPVLTASLSHRSRSTRSDEASASDSGMNAIMSTAPVRGCGAGCGSLRKSTSSRPARAASHTATTSCSPWPTSLSDERAYASSEKESTSATHGVALARAAIEEMTCLAAVEK
eukprot:CAMPEP_0119354922 /NCGR_PEP_ID=MMETSP1334-20130426/3892_1 /TAXON_ID=127549 /ORGANISM="Calcidiscus leptoporus, Strain RCC1130" /LENGTH=171 /DNA_ID=CAMNT_0007368635 /DNA_START=601 /DNA_END=1116 /DNA_ORIENTATION=+